MRTDRRVRCRAFGRNESFRAHERALFVNARHQTDVRKLGLTVDEDDVRWFYIAMHESVPMKVSERTGELHAQRNGIGHWQPCAGFEFGSESAGTEQFRSSGASAELCEGVNLRIRV